MHKSQSSFYLTTALHVSGVTITHFQEHKTTVTTASGNRCLCQQPHENKTDQHRTYNTLKSVPYLLR